MVIWQAATDRNAEGPSVYREINSCNFGRSSLIDEDSFPASKCRISCSANKESYRKGVKNRGNTGIS